MPVHTGAASSGLLEPTPTPVACPQDILGGGALTRQPAQREAHGLPGSQAGVSSKGRESPREPVVPLGKHAQGLEMGGRDVGPERSEQRCSRWLKVDAAPRGWKVERDAAQPRDRVLFGCKKG